MQHHLTTSVRKTTRMLCALLAAHGLQLYGGGSLTKLEMNSDHSLSFTVSDRGPVCVGIPVNFSATAECLAPDPSQPEDLTITVIEGTVPAETANPASGTGSVSLNGVSSQVAGRGAIQATAASDAFTLSHSVDVMKVDIDLGPTKICKGMEGTYTIPLTEDSWTDGGTTWDSGCITGGSGGAVSYTFTPADQGAGGAVVATTVTASATAIPTCSDTVQIRLYRQAWGPRATDTISVNPGLTGNDVKTAADLDEVLDTLEAQLTQIEASIRQWIPEDDPQEDDEDTGHWYTAWKDWNPAKTFAEYVEDWIAGKMTQIANAVADAKEAVPAKINDLCATIAEEVNEKLSTDVEVQADYNYWCGEFDPATDGKGWTDVTVCDPEIETISAGMKFGIDGLSVAAEPLGVGASISVQGFVEFEASAILEPKGTPELLQPGNEPSATSKVKMQLKVSASAVTVQTALLTLSPSGGITLNKELAGPDGTGFPITMEATRQECGGASPFN